MATDLGLLIGVVVLTLVCGSIASASAKGSLPRNGAVGIRTKATKSSDAAWDAGHRAAVPMMRVTTWFGVLLTVVTIVAVIILRPGEEPGWEVVAPVVGFAGMFLGLVAAGVIADRAAKAVQ